jgi:hypothetical protein
VDKGKFDEIEGMMEIAAECSSIDMLRQYMRNIDLRYAVFLLFFSFNFKIAAVRF